jgi:indolepyruvate ferredoxin oxidoreductase beta subunit
MGNKLDVVLTGVGGQGVVTASNIFSEVLFLTGYDVKQSDIYGMSQREGPIISHVRADKKVYSPVISCGQADYMLALEQLEAYRWRHLLNQNSVLLLNTKKIVPITMKNPIEYPPNIIESMNSVCKVRIVDCSEELRKLELKEKYTNVLMMGLFSQYLTDIDETIWYSVIRQSFSKETLEDNLKAFKAGRNF